MLYVERGMSGTGLVIRGAILRMSHVTIPEFELNGFLIYCGKARKVRRTFGAFQTRRDAFLSAWDGSSENECLLNRPLIVFSIVGWVSCESAIWNSAAEAARLLLARTEGYGTETRWCDVMR